MLKTLFIRRPFDVLCAEFQPLKQIIAFTQTGTHRPDISVADSSSGSGQNRPPSFALPISASNARVQSNRIVLYNAILAFAAASDTISCDRRPPQQQQQQQLHLWMLCTTWLLWNRVWRETIAPGSGHAQQIWKRRWIIRIYNPMFCFVCNYCTMNELMSDARQLLLHNCCNKTSPH